jgi:ubiquinone biosynthesis accessory factor UbiK
MCQIDNAHGNNPIEIESGQPLVMRTVFGAAARSAALTWSAFSGARKSGRESACTCLGSTVEGQPPEFARLGEIVRVAPWKRNPAMLNSKVFDELAAKINQIIQSSPAKDIEKNVKAMLASGLSKLDVVPRAEFDVQAQVLLKTREKLETLERRLAELEARIPPDKTI